jgi:dethiobiotin synthetase
VLARVTLPSLLVLPADVGAGKTLVAGAIADWFRRRGSRVAVSVPVQTGAPHRREGLVSDEAEFLAGCADSRHPLDLICPQRFAEDSIPSFAAERAGRPVDWDAIDRSVRIISRDADAIIVQAPAPLMTPVDGRRTVRDMVVELGAPVLVVTRPGLREVHRVVLSTDALRAAGATVAGVVVNRYPAESPTVEQEASLRQIERWARLPVLCVVPQEREPVGPQLPANITGVIDLVDWRALSRA